MGQDMSRWIQEEGERQLREERDRYRDALMRISNLENTHEDWKDAAGDAIQWARKALTAT